MKTPHKYYMVVAQRGHCGNNRAGEIKFAFHAANLISAMDRAKRMPSVKHTRAILYGYEISENEYNEYRQKSAYERFPQGKR